MIPHILFINHEASRTGAPIVLLHLLRQLKKERACSFSILLINGGELEEEFNSLATTYVWHQSAPVPQWKHYSFRLLGYTAANRQHRHELSILAHLRKQRVDVVYGNTAVTSGLVTRLKKELNCVAVCHVHELEIAIERYYGTVKFGAELPAIDLVIAASEAVRDNLVSTYPLLTRPIAKVYEFVPDAAAAAEQLTAAGMRASLRIPPGSQVVAASGTFDWRKAPDLFVQIASHLHRTTAKEAMPYFLWIGGSTSSLAWMELQYDLQRLGIAEYVKFIGVCANPLDYLRLAEVFVLTSREDPYPLVCLEAASLGKPVICFAQSGGMPEFVEQDCGIVVPYLRIDLMSQAIQQLLANAETRHEMGANALLKVRSRHNVASAAHQIMHQLTLLLDKAQL